MSHAIIYITAVIFVLLLFPIHISNYVYADTHERYASLNVCAYRYIRFFNVNTVKDKPNHMMVNGKDKEINLSRVKANAVGVMRRLQFTKIVQLGDYGILNENSAYAAVIQRSATDFLYCVFRNLGSVAKLKNYTVLNQTHGGVRYYAKIEVAVNLIAVLNIIIYLISEKIK